MNLRFKGHSHICQDTGCCDTLEEACHAQSPNLQDWEISQIKSSEINGRWALFPWEIHPDFFEMCFIMMFDVSSYINMMYVHRNETEWFDKHFKGVFTQSRNQRSGQVMLIVESIQIGCHKELHQKNKSWFTSAVHHRTAGCLLSQKNNITKNIPQTQGCPIDSLL